MYKPCIKDLEGADNVIFQVDCNEITIGGSMGVVAKKAPISKKSFTSKNSDLTPISVSLECNHAQKIE
jgi:hypothetical protein